MNTQNIKDEIYNYVLKLDLNKEEQAVIIDTYKKEIPLKINELVRSFAYKKNFTDKDLKVPHMGWSQVESSSSNHWH